MEIKSKPVQSLCFPLSSEKCLLWFLLSSFFSEQDRGRKLLLTKPLKSQTSSIPKLISGTTSFHYERILGFQTWLTLYFVSLASCAQIFCSLYLWLVFIYRAMCYQAWLLERCNRGLWKGSMTSLDVSRLTGRLRCTLKREEENTRPRAFPAQGGF